VSDRDRWEVVTVDVDGPIEDVPTGGASVLHVTVTAGGRPVGVVPVPVAGSTCPGWYLREVVVAALGWELWSHRLRGLVAGPDGGGPPPDAAATVLVCTADRPASLDRCLASIGRLACPPADVVVVDNSREAVERTRAVVEAHGARYVREPLGGLDRARNAGLRAVSTPLVLCTDDDVEVEPGWAAALIRGFDDPLVMAVTGLVLPASLATGALRRAERFTGHVRGFTRRVVDGAWSSGMHAGGLGSGASMAWRADFARAAGGFPDELDAGTPTRSGGDHYLLREVLRRGYRVLYEPAAVARHWHRDSDEAMLAAVRGYGTGLGSLLLHAIRVDRDREAVAEGVPALARYYGSRVTEVVTGDRWARRAALAELAGATGAFRAHAASVVASSRRGRPERDDLGPMPAPWLDRLARDVAPRSPDALPALSVVIPTRGRRERVLRLLRAIDEQHYPDDRLEVVVVVDGDVDGTATALADSPLRRRPAVVVLDAPGRDAGAGNGAGYARARGLERVTGEVVLFLDDDVVPLHHEVLAAHAGRHLEHLRGGGRPLLCVGPLPVDHRSGAGLLEQRMRNWWVEHGVRVEETEVLPFTAVCSGNLSAPAAFVRRVGGMSAMARREDWELGYRAVAAGAEVVSEHDAAVVHDLDVGLANALGDRRREGQGDVAFLTAHPSSLAQLTLSRWFDLERRSRWLAEQVLARPGLADTVLRIGVPAAGVLEGTGRRVQHGRLVNRLSFVAYWRGVGDAAGGERGITSLLAGAVAVRGAPLDVQLGDLATFAPVDGASGGEVRVWLADRLLAVVPLHRGDIPWSSATFADRVRGEVAWAALVAAGATGSVR
jgi:glycosyltransferase involved in cell wall biosynthesis